MAVLGGKLTLADAINYPSTDPLCIFLESAITFGAYHPDAARHLNGAFHPISAIGLQIGVTFVAPGVA
jgi:hypothetical protein